MNILVSDDDRIQVQLVTVFLRKAGFSVSAAFDAIQAFTMAIRIQPSLVLLDVNMPGGTGLEVLKRLRNPSETNQIPVIVVSGSIDPKTAALVKGMCADEYLTKPCSHLSRHRLPPGEITGGSIFLVERPEGLGEEDKIARAVGKGN